MITLTSIENEFKKVGHDIVVGAKATEAAAAKIATFLTNEEPTINAVLADVDPAAATFTEFAESLAAKALAFVGDAGNAITASGASLPLDATAIADAKALYTALKSKTGAVAIATKPATAKA